MSVKYLVLPILVSLVIISGCGGTEAEPVTTLTGLDKVSVGADAARELAIARCREMYNQNLALGTDFNNSPCLAEEIVAGWACAVTPEANPATAKNNCASYQNGVVDQIVVLDINGQLLSAE